MPSRLEIADALTAVQYDVLNLARGPQTPESEFQGTALTTVAVALAWCLEAKPATEAEQALHEMLTRATTRGARLREAVFRQRVK